MTSRSAWKDVYGALRDENWQENIILLDQFFGNNTPLELLSFPFESFPPPDSDSKANFDSLTSAINISPDDKAPYDIQQIKSDSLWLSKEVNIEEPAALRMVVLEWQKRAQIRLQSGACDDALSRRDEPESNLRASARDKLPAPSELDPEHFNSEEQRRLRLLRIYLAEKTSVLKIIGWLFCVQCPTRPRQPLGLLNKIGDSTFKILRASSFTKELKLVPYIEAIRKRLQQMDAGSGFLAASGGNADIEMLWAEAQLAEMIEIMQLFFILITRTKGAPASEVVISFFTLMAEFRFFTGIFEQLVPLSAQFLMPN